MLPIFHVPSPTIVVYRLLYLGLYCFSLTVGFCFCFHFFETLVKYFSKTRPELNLQWSLNWCSCRDFWQEAFLVVILKDSLAVLSTIPVRVAHSTAERKTTTCWKNCLKFHSAEDKRQQSYVYEEAGQREPVKHGKQDIVLSRIVTTKKLFIMKAAGCIPLFLRLPWLLFWW